jgi:hypothetical protein
VQHFFEIHTKIIKHAPILEQSLAHGVVSPSDPDIGYHPRQIEFAALCKQVSWRVQPISPLVGTTNNVKTL